MWKKNRYAVIVPVILGMVVSGGYAQDDPDSAAPSVGGPAPSAPVARPTAVVHSTPAAAQAPADEDSAEPVSVNELTSREAVPVSPLVQNKYTSMPDLADRLRKVDKNATIVWDERVLRITCSGQRFAIFPNSNSVVLNGTPEKVARGIQFDQGEIFVSPELNALITAKVTAVTAAASETSATQTPVPTPTPTPTPKPVLNLAGTTVSAEQDSAVPVVSPTSTPTPILTETTPVPTPSPTPKPTPVPTMTPPPPKPTITVTPVPAEDHSRLAILRNETKIARERSIGPQSGTALQLAVKSAPLRVVVIDPDPLIGVAKNPQAQEANRLAMRLCRDLEASFKKQGVETVLTCVEDGAPEVTERLKVINDNRTRAQLVLSVRVAASSGNSKFCGPRVFGMNETVDADVLSTADGEKLPPEQFYRLFTPQVRQQGLALVKALNSEDEKAKVVPLATYIGKRSPLPYLMVEAGNLSSARNAADLRKDKYLESMADTIVQTLISTGQPAKSASGGPATGGPR